MLQPATVKQAAGKAKLLELTVEALFKKHRGFPLKGIGPSSNQTSTFTRNVASGMNKTFFSENFLWSNFLTFLPTECSKRFQFRT